MLVGAVSGNFGVVTSGVHFYLTTDHRVLTRRSLYISQLFAPKYIIPYIQKSKTVQYSITPAESADTKIKGWGALKGKLWPAVVG